MSNKDNAIEFTESKYTSRKEMSNILGISVPEEMWNKIVNYRQSFYHVSSLKDVENRNLFLCLYPTFANKVANIDVKLSRIASDAEKLDDLNGDKEHFKFAAIANELKTLAVKNSINIELPRIKKLINSENPFDESEERLLNYFYALQYIEENHDKVINVDFLADLYSKVTGINELTYFYRNNNISDIDSIALVSRVYKSAPAEKIEPMMEALFAFIESSTLSTVNKALVAYYYVSYIKPFKDFNDEIATLIAKAIIAHFSLGAIGSIIPFESLLVQKPDALRKMNQDVISTADLTYFISPTAFHLDKDIDEVIDVLKDYSINNIRNDFYQMDEEPLPAPAPIKEEVIIEEKVENKPEPVVEPVVEEKPQIIEKEEVLVKPVPVVEEEVEEKEEPLPSQGLAFGYIPNKIDEKEAQRLEEHLLEMDYRLKKGEAKFYARHCSLGMYYTIEQYRKCIKCVYETARTSMDHLAELGYYIKTKHGKKFLYTPAKRK